MLSTGNVSLIDADFIFDRLTEEEIMTRYTGHPVVEGYYFCSPWRRDRFPTCTFKRVRGKLRFTDWADGKSEDAIGVVMRLYNLSYREAVEHIAATFGLSPNTPVTRPREMRAVERKETSHRDKSLIQITRQELTGLDLAYLASYGISPEIAARYGVYSPRIVWLGGRQQYQYRAADPALAYYFGKSREGFERWKIYFYTRRHHTVRFMGNTNRIQGWAQLPERASLLIMTKSLKDVMCLSRFGISAIAMQSETMMPYDYIIEELRSRFDRIVSLYDFDRAGITGAMKLRRLYGIEPLFLTNGRFGTPDMGAKDFSDFYKRFGEKETLALLYTAAITLGLDEKKVFTHMDYLWNLLQPS